VIGGTIMKRVFAKILVVLLVTFSAPAEAATVMVTSTADDTVGQSIVYSLRDQINRSSLYKVAYTREDSGFIIQIVTIPENDGRTAAYSAVLTMPPLDKKGFDYYITSVVGYCGADVTNTCASRILSSFDHPMSEMIGEMTKMFKKPN